MSDKSVKRVAQLEDLRDLISQAEAARIRGVTRAAIRDLIRRKRLRSVEVGSREFVYRSEVEAFEKGKPVPKK